MFWSWSFLFGGIIYTLVGLITNEIVKDYMKEMSEKVSKIDERFVNRLFITVKAKSERAKDILSILLFVIWPITDVWIILKAEYEFGNLKKHVYYKGAP